MNNLQLPKLLICASLCSLLTQTSFALTDKYRCIIRDEPSTTMTIGWDQVSGANAVVYYGTTDQGTNFDKYPLQIYPQRSLHAKGMNNHYARLSNLKPNTVYYFVIRDSEGTSQRFWFKTLPDDHRSRLSIVAGGDSRNHRTARLAANKTIPRLRPDFILFDGDMTGGDTDREWIEWFNDWQQTIAKDGRMTPIVPARGNHERSNQSIVDMFDVRHPDIYYALTFARGLLRVYTLNSMMPASGEQREWLEQDLMNNQDAAWRISQYHHPMRPHTTRKGEHEYLRRLWAPLFDQYKMNLALECDSHVAKVTHGIRSSNEPGNEEGFVRDDDGTYYIGEGGWGAPLREADDAKKWTMGIGSFNHVNWIFIDLDKIEVRVVKTDNIDAAGFVTDQTRFSTPDNLDLWAFNAQSCLTIYNKMRNDFRPREAQNTMEIIAIEAAQQNEKVKLTWQATFEFPQVRYKVQSSTNKLFWKTLGIVNGLGGATDKVNKYSFNDQIPAKGGKYFYRVVSVDAAGVEKVKRDIEVRVVGNEKMETLFASLTSGQLLVDIDLPTDARVNIEMLDVNRKRVFIQDIAYKRGKHNVPLNVKHLLEGYYLLEISYNEQLIRKNVKISKPSPAEN